MSARRAFAQSLAGAMLAGTWTRRAMLERTAKVVGAAGMPLRSLINAVLRQHETPPLDGFDALTQFVVGRLEVTQLRRMLLGELPRYRLQAFEPRMRPARWPVQELHTLADVQQWLGLPTRDLEWLADRKGLERSARDPRMRNYQYVWVRKPGGGMRLIEAPKQRLMNAQRRVLHEILDAIPPHDAAHGFRTGRSVLTHARLHAACETVVRFDLRAFFTHVQTPRAYGVFRAAGYPEQVARTLIAMCTNSVPNEVLARVPFDERARLGEPHLPQGAPTSPALANLVARSLDLRLTALARRFGSTYSRYADDLTFSGDRHLCTGGALEAAVDHIVRNEGFALNAKKTRVMRTGHRQHVTGVIVNDGVSAPRDEADRLKATLHNCLVRGLAHEARGVPNFREHLAGRVAWVALLNPARGARLTQMLAAISPASP